MSKDFPIPHGQHAGRTIFRFLQWLARHKTDSVQLLKFSGDEAPFALANPLNIPDLQFIPWYKEFLLSEASRSDKLAETLKEKTRKIVDQAVFEGDMSREEADLWIAGQGRRDAGGEI